MFKGENMLEESRDGWCWHFRVYNYLTREMKAFNSQKPFKTAEEATLDLLEFIKQMIPEVKDV